MSQEKSNIGYFQEIRKDLDFLLKAYKNDHVMDAVKEDNKTYPPMNTNCQCHECTQARYQMRNNSI